jgi:hypothetical protein
MTRSIFHALSMTAAAAMLLCAAAPAFAQDPPPASSVPPPMQAMSAPKGSDDMTGSIGFGVGVAAGAQTLIAPINDTVAIKYWLSDVLAVSPGLTFRIVKPTPPGGMSPQTDTQWNFSPSATVLFVPFRSTTTRFEVGGGLAISLSKNPPADTAIAFGIPLQAGVEHFFARWFSMGIAAGSNLFTYEKNVQVRIFDINTTRLVGQLFFYTD